MISPLRPSAPLFRASAALALFFLLAVSVGSVVLSSAASAKTLVTKSYYVPIYAAPRADAPVLGNLLKDQLAKEISRRGEWVQLNAFKGLLVGWARAQDFEVGGKKRLRALQDGVSPTFPGADQMSQAQAHAAPHGGGYRGVQHCVRCHNAGAAHIKGAGRPIEVWSHSSHARAYYTLFSPKALRVAKRLGITSPSNSPRCLKCHLTAYGVSMQEQREVFFSEGVGCEACHGPSGALHGSGGVWDVEPVANRARFCRRCHNDESPTWRGFNLEAFSAFIAHWGHQEEVPTIRAREHEEMARQSARAGDPPPAPLTPELSASPAAAPLSATPEEGVIILSSGVGAPVRFPHARHQQELGLSCETCHHVPNAYKCSGCHTDASAVSRQEAFHDGSARSCRNCHRKMARQGFAGPRACGGCHVQR